MTFQRPVAGVTARTVLLLFMAGAAVGTVEYDDLDAGYHPMPFAMGPNGVPFCLVSSEHTVHVRHLPPSVHCIHRTDDYSDRGLPDAQGNVDFAQPVLNGTEPAEILLEWYTDAECTHYLPGSDLVITCRPGDLKPRRPCHPNPCEFGGACKPFDDPLGIGYRCLCPFGQVNGRCAPPTRLSALYAGGFFTEANVVRSSGIVRWDGNQYAGFNGGIFGDVRALVEFRNDLIAGGSFSMANLPRTEVFNIARWDGRRWVQLGETGLDGRVLAMAVYKNELYVGGEFTSTVGHQVLPVSFLARWDGHTWRSVGTGTDGPVRALAVQNGRLFLGGDFTSAGGRTAKFIASWDGHSFASLRGELDGPVFALAPDPMRRSGLYVGGEFVKAGFLLVNRIARWTGRVWAPLGTGFSDRVRAIAVQGSLVFAGGEFLKAGLNKVNYIARFIQSTRPPFGPPFWTDVFGGVDLPVLSLVIANGTLFAGGLFNNAGVLSSPDGGIPVNGIASWRPASSWQPLGEGLNGLVWSLLPSTRFGLVIGGAFPIAANPIVVNRIARLNRDETWSPLGTGTDGLVNNIVGVPPRHGQFVRLFAGGFFSFAGGRLVNAIAEWDGCEWKDLDGGVGAPIFRMAYNPQNRSLYASGEFTEAGGVPANRIAGWDTVRDFWYPLGEGLSGEPGEPRFAANSMLTLGEIVFFGGFFTIAGGQPAPFIARWDGVRWSSVGEGMNEVVDALTLFQGRLIAGGSFTLAGGVPATRIAQWDGTTWAPVGTGEGANNVVANLLSTDHFLYAAGIFDRMDGILVNFVARWDGVRWGPLGPGVNGGAGAMAIFNGYLYLGGFFTGLADGSLPAAGLLRWHLARERWETVPYELRSGAVIDLAVVAENRWAGACPDTAYTTLGDDCPYGECDSILVA